MKSMTCSQLGGACDKVFKAESFEEIAALSKQHAMEMINNQDNAHLEAMQKMQELMQSPKLMQQWFKDKKLAFEALPNQ